jgi:hypothetical protein
MRLTCGLSIADTTHVTYVARTETMRRTIPFHKMYQIMSAFLLIAPSHRAEDRTMVFCHRTNEVKAFFVTALNAFIQRIADIKASAASGKLANRRAQCGLLCQAEESGGDIRPTLSSAPRVHW